MQSPIDPKAVLQKTELEGGLVAFTCPTSGGHWITSENYWRWKNSLPPSEDLPNPSEHNHQPSEFDGTIKLCPETGTILTRYHVGHGIDFRIERSINGGIWLDGGEWETLRSENLHRQLHLIFTTPWQKAIRDAEQAAAYEKMIAERLGPDLLARLKDLRNDLPAGSDRAAAMAYLHLGDA